MADSIASYLVKLVPKHSRGENVKGILVEVRAPNAEAAVLSVRSRTPYVSLDEWDVVYVRQGIIR